MICDTERWIYGLIYEWEVVTVLFYKPIYLCEKNKGFNHDLR